MLSGIINFIAKIGVGASTMCLWGWFDEPEMPKSMLKK